MHILVVDDNADIRTLVNQILASVGHKVTNAGDGIEALQLEAMHTPDAVILDVNLPLLDGYEVCRRIKARRDVPVMMLTVRAERHEIDLARKAGADFHLTKPFEMLDFLNHIQMLCA